MSKSYPQLGNWKDRLRCTEPRTFRLRAAVTPVKRKVVICHHSCDTVVSLPSKPSNSRQVEWIHDKNVITSQSRCGEMADATDLKSVFTKVKCGFESRHRQLNILITR